MKCYENLTLDEERALYSVEDALVRQCIFDGPADGESALKETSGLTVENCRLNSEYPFLQNRDMEIVQLTMTGKYSFQYVENAQLRNCMLDTKDAFWHSKNVSVYDSVIKGEYLAWYSENLRLVRCKIIRRSAA